MRWFQVQTQLLGNCGRGVPHGHENLLILSLGQAVHQLVERAPVCHEFLLTLPVLRVDARGAQHEVVERHAPLAINADLQEFPVCDPSQSGAHKARRQHHNAGAGPGRATAGLREHLQRTHALVHIRWAQGTRALQEVFELQLRPMVSRWSTSCGPSSAVGTIESAAPLPSTPALHRAGSVAAQHP